MGTLPPAGSPMDPLNAPSLSAFANAVRATLNNSDVTVDDRIAAIPAPAGGSTILSGTATPTGATGNVGDYYLDTDDRVLYGPKAPTGVFGPGKSVIGVAPPSQTSNGTDRSYGMRFRVMTDGRITGLRFWPWTPGTTTRTLYLWSDVGALLGSVPVTTAVYNAGWVVGTLATPVGVSNGTYYRVAYDVTAPENYALASGGIAPASADFEDAVSYYSNGFGVFPTTVNAGPNRFIDVVMEPTPPMWPVALKSIPPGGTTGQSLKKTGTADYAVGWVT